MPDEVAPALLASPLIDAVRKPIPGGSPVGIDVAYEDDFQSLKAEVDAMGAATGSVDFQNIVDLATTILAERSKDISVACYLAFGLSRTRGFAGVAEGVAVVRAVSESFWEGAFPPLRRMRARQSAIQFMAERLNAWAETQKPTPADRGALDTGLAELSALQAFTTESMGDDAPPLSGLARTLREAIRRLPAPREDAPAGAMPTEPAQPSATQAPPAASASAAPGASAGEPVDASFGTRSESESVVLKVAAFLREQSVLDATAIMLTRAVRWGAIAQAPPAEGGKTKIPAPQAARRSAIMALVGTGNHEALAKACEGAFQEAPFHFWLDLQRAAATGFAALGAPGAAALAAVTDSASALVRRVPVLPTLSFADGTSFADPLTIAWLDEISAVGGDGSSSGASNNDPGRDAIREAQSQASGGDVPGAVAALVAGSGAPRDRFDRTIAAAEMCMGAGRPDVALALLDDADEAIRQYHLDVWDPPSARNALRLMHAACAALAPSAGTPDRKQALASRSDEAFARLARLDPGLAMRSTAPPKKT